MNGTSPPARTAARIWLVIAIGAVVVVLAHFVAGSKPRFTPPGWLWIAPPAHVTALTIHGDTVWAGGRDGVYAIDRRSGNVVRQLTDGPPFAYVRGLLVDDSGALWIGHQAGLTVYDGGSYRTMTVGDGLPDNRVTCLLRLRDGSVLLGTYGGGAIWRGGSWTPLPAGCDLIDPMINVALEDPRGGLWFGSYVAPRGGLTIAGDGRARHYHTENGLPHNNVNAILALETGTVWVGTGFMDRGGMAEFVRDREGWQLRRTLGTGDGLAGAKVRSLFLDSAGGLWCGSESDGVAYRRHGRWRVLTEADGLSHREVLVMAEDRDGQMWFGTRAGLTRLTPAARDHLIE